MTVHSPEVGQALRTQLAYSVLEVCLLTSEVMIVRGARAS
jgi:hypothetical protein